MLAGRSAVSGCGLEQVRFPEMLPPVPRTCRASLYEGKAGGYLRLPLVVIIKAIPNNCTKHGPPPLIAPDNSQLQTAPLSRVRLGVLLSK